MKISTIAPLLAWRYLWRTAYEQSISTMIRICFVGIFIGAFSLALVTAVMQGFENAVYEKMQGIHANIIIRSTSDPLDVKALNDIFAKSFPEVIASSPQATGNAIIRSDEENENGPRVVLLKGISPAREAAVSAIGQKLVKQAGNATSLEQAIHGNHVAIGKQLAQDLGLHVGDELELFYSDPEKMRGNKLQLKDTSTIIGGIFETGIDEFDSGMILCSLEFFGTLFGADIQQVNVKLKAGTNDTLVIEELRSLLGGVSVYSWKDLYPALVSALLLEKYAMFLILVLITLVASMNILSLLFMEITNKRGDIAILKAFGARNHIISQVFIFIGLSITSIASAAGIAAAYGVSLLLERYPFIQLPDSYYVSHLPADMDWCIAISVFCVVVGLGFFATWLPTRKVRSINVAQVLRFEG